MTGMQVTDASVLAGLLRKARSTARKGTHWLETLGESLGSDAHIDSGRLAVRLRELYIGINTAIETGPLSHEEKRLLHSDLSKFRNLEEFSAFADRNAHDQGIFREEEIAFLDRIHLAIRNFASIHEPSPDVLKSAKEKILSSLADIERSEIPEPLKGAIIIRLKQILFAIDNVGYFGAAQLELQLNELLGRVLVACKRGPFAEVLRRTILAIAAVSAAIVGANETWEAAEDLIERSEISLKLLEK